MFFVVPMKNRCKHPRLEPRCQIPRAAAEMLLHTLDYKPVRNAHIGRAVLERDPIDRAPTRFALPQQLVSCVVSSFPVDYNPSQSRMRQSIRSREP